MPNNLRYKQELLHFGKKFKKSPALFDSKARKMFENRRQISEKKFKLTINTIRAKKPVMLRQISIPELQMRRISDEVNRIAREVALGKLPKEALIEKLGIVKTNRPAGLKQADGSLNYERQLWEFKYKENQPIKGHEMITYPEVKVYPVEGSIEIVKALPNGKELVLVQSILSKKAKVEMRIKKEKKALEKSKAEKQKGKKIRLPEKRISDNNWHD